LPAERFTNEQIERYARHIILPQVGGKGQRRLLGSRVLVVGAGGLGSPVLLYLAAAGVGTIDIIDFDVVDASNLQRQVIHTTADLGRPKAISAAESIRALNPDVNVVVHEDALLPSNALELFRACDVIVEGSDNFPTRYLVNDAAHLARKPLVSGALFQFEGQVTVFPNDGGADSPCLRCLFPEPPAPGLIPSCQEAGIFGVVPGIIGSMQAAEVIKLLLGIGKPLAGRMLTLDALAMKWREIKLRRNPRCPLNGDSPTIKALLDDYGQAAAGCTVKPLPKAP
jgi:molybdopterin/thiamine biosynthesis adenylyltransferase